VTTMALSFVLDELSRTLLSDLSTQRRDALSPEEMECLEQHSITRPPASEEEVQAAERRLAVVLPEDFKQFLRTSNGVMLPEVAGHARWMSPVGEVRRVEQCCPEVVTFWTEFGSGHDFSPLSAMPGAGNVMLDEQPDLQLLSKALVLVEPSGPGDGLFLTPFPRFGSDAWEVWLVDPHAGCTRFRRMIDMLEFQLTCLD